MKIALLSIKDLSGFVADDDLVVEPLRRLGHVAEFVPWQDAVDWRDYDGVVIRTTWDYQNDLPAFLCALEHIESQTRLVNPLELVKWNADKRLYIRDLETRGARIIPTIWNDQKIESQQIQEWFDQLQTEEIVIKPTVGANAHDAIRFKQESKDADALSKTFEGRSYMVQPFMRGIVDEGEFSLLYFNGEYSHAILKTPKLGDFRVQEEHGGLIQTVEPASDLLATGKKVFNCVSPTPLYARLDFVRTGDGGFAVVELELIEPSMYLRQAEHAPDLFAKAIDRWLLQTSTKA